MKYRLLLFNKVDFAVFLEIDTIKFNKYNKFALETVQLSLLSCLTLFYFI